MASETTIWTALLPVQGNLIYAGPLYCFVFGVIGIGVMNAHKITHPIIKPYVYVGGTVCILLQFVFLGIDIGQYDGFIFLDGIMLPWKLIVHPSSYSSISSIFMLLMPCLGIVGTVLWSVCLWIKFKPE